MQLPLAHKPTIDLELEQLNTGGGPTGPDLPNLANALRLDFYQHLSGALYVKSPSAVGPCWEHSIEAYTQQP
jgi:hypothetical protein